MPYKILVLEPVRDEAASQREQEARQAPALRQHELEYVYASEGVPLDQTVPMQARLVRSQQKALDEDALLHRLNERVTEFHADLLLVNSGPLFRRYPDELLFMMRALKARHPALRIGFHPRTHDRRGPQQCFEYTNEMGGLLAAVFGEMLR